MLTEKHSPNKPGRRGRIQRDARTGRYAVIPPSGAELSETVTPRSPRAFIEEFTSHPVVDDVMKRWSR